MMKKIIYFLTVLLLFVGSDIFAQVKVQREQDKQNNVSFVQFNTDSIVPMNEAAGLLKRLQPEMKESDEWKFSKKKKEQSDEQGYTHRFYRQYHKGYAVEGGEFGVHATIDGKIETVLGAFVPIGKVSVNIKFSEDQALKAALKYIGAESYKWQIPEEEAWMKEYFNSSYYPEGELVIVKDRLKTDSTYRLAYKFDISAHKPMSSNYVWADAITGEIIDIESRIHFTNATGTAATRYSGTRNITTDSYTANNVTRFRLRPTINGVNISTFNLNHTGNYTSTDFTDNNNNWTDAEFNNANNDNAGLDAHWGAEMVYEYFKQVHNRNSWNDNNGAMLSYVNGNLPAISSQFSNSDNAFWANNRMTYGEGSTLPPYVPLDVCAHEIGHGICQSTAGLGNSGESGAINESLSDIWGACLENYVNTTYGLSKDVWLHREELGIANRSLSNPSLFGQPDTYGTNTWNSNADVHTNSGVGNFWFFLLSQGGTGTNDLGNTYNVTEIGINKAAAIVYKAETSYLTSSANYAQFRNATISAATNLYGANSLEVASVTNAWYAVGVGSQHPIALFGNNNPYCFQQVIYNLVSVPTGATVTWSGSSNVNIVSGQGTSQATISICGGSTATLTATLSGAVNQVLNKNLTVNNGEFVVTRNINNMVVTLNHPYAQCFDWIIPTNISSQVGNGTKTCISNSTLTFTSSTGNNGTIQVRAKDGSCTTQWFQTEFKTWYPEIDIFNSNLEPANIEYFYANLVEPFFNVGISTVQYYWYFDVDRTPFLYRITNVPYIEDIENWICDRHTLAVTVHADNYQASSGYVDYFGRCKNVTWSSAYPNPASNELIIDKIEDNSAETTAVNTQSARGKISEIRVLLYSNSTAQLVYNKTYSSSEKQIKIDTSKLPNGIYHLNIIENGEKIKEQTIVVSH